MLFIIIQELVNKITIAKEKHKNENLKKDLDIANLKLQT
uniref:Uncharacterized protein n=1 Tax=viral metagenome TaxID=1070528 RepID=A0A6C0LS95_9ZZZZ